MGCTKTGCHVYVAPYGEFAYGDAFEIGRVAYFRIVDRAHDPIRPVIHYTIHGFDNWFEKDRPRGEASTLITADFVNHGYDGIAPPTFQAA